MDAELRHLLDDMRQENLAMRQENLAMRQENLALHAETRRLFHVVAERLEQKIDIIAEGVIRVDQKIDREIAGLRGEMLTGFADTHALIRFSHRDLDQRLRALES